MPHMHGHDFGLRGAMDNNLGKSIPVAAPTFSINEDFPRDMRKLLNSSERLINNILAYLTRQRH
jgi:hypothetical protein